MDHINETKEEKEEEMKTEVVVVEAPRKNVPVSRSPPVPSLALPSAQPQKYIEPTASAGSTGEKDSARDYSARGLSSRRDRYECSIERKRDVAYTYAHIVDVPLQCNQ